MAIPYLLLAPLIALVVAAVATLALAAAAPRRRDLTVAVATFGVLIAAALAAWGWRTPRGEFGGTAVADPLAVAFGVLGLATVLATLLLSLPFGAAEGWEGGEYEALLLFAAGGMLVLAVANDLLLLLIGIELLALPLYLLAGFPGGRESALRYFLLGVVAFATQAYGTALVYGAVGGTAFDALAGVALGDGAQPLVLAGLALVFAGLGFKLALAPFHQWAPDAYAGAPTPVLVVLAAGTKVAVVAALIRLLRVAVPQLQPFWGPALAVVALVTVLVGSIGVLRQRELGRLIAYSGVAQVGLVVLALAAGGAAAGRAALLGLVSYAAATAALVAIFAMLPRLPGGEGRTLAALGGVPVRRGVAAALVVALLSLGGIPPTAGFAGKLALLTAALGGVQPWIVLVAALASVATVAAYVRVFLAAMQPPAAPASVRLVSSSLLSTVLLVATAVTLLVGLVPWLIGWRGGVFGGL